MILISRKTKGAQKSGNLYDTNICLTCEDCGFFQLTGTKTGLELEPDEVDEVLRVTAMARAFPSLPPLPCSSSYLRPITGVYIDINMHRQTQTYNWTAGVVFGNNEC